MERWSGRVAIVTGASSGIGEAVAKELARHGMKVAALARRTDKLKNLQDECKKFPGIVKCYKCDVTVEEEITKTFQQIVDDLGPVSVLVNNAGILTNIPLTDTSKGSSRKVYETNVIGLVTCTQHAVGLMRSYKIDDGHIININSILGHSVAPAPGVANYCASKHAVTAISESLKNELSALDSNIRVTSISPGLVQTIMADFITENLGHSMVTLNAKDIADCIIFVLGTRPNINISELTVQPVRECISSFK